MKVGDTFKAASGGYPGDRLVYKVTGREQHLGRDAFVITMQSVPGAMQTISAKNYSVG